MSINYMRNLKSALRRFYSGNDNNRVVSQKREEPKIKEVGRYELWGQDVESDYLRFSREEMDALRRENSEWGESNIVVPSETERRDKD